MKDDYLWDRSGQPDPEIQQLEDILGELRHQPRPLEIPAEPHIDRNGLFSPRYAIAAAVAMIVLSLGVWLAIQRQRPTDVTAGNPQQSKPTDLKSNTAQEDSKTAAANPIDEKKLSSLSARNNTPGPELTKDSQPRRDRPASSSRARRNLGTPRMSEAELAEAEEAKERLMLALRLASSKLIYAQRKTQGSGTANQVHNQHKIG